MDKRRSFKSGRFHIFLIFILFINLNFSCKKDTPIETEPNNTFYNSNRLEIDSTVQGFFNTDNDKDFFILDIKSPMIVDIELSSVKGINHAFRVWTGKAGQTLVKYVDDARKSSSERICNLFVDMGVYYIAVSHGDRDTPKANVEDAYQLRVTGRPWESEELEANDNFESANPIEVGREISGCFSPSFNKMNKSATSHYKEEDWFYFDVNLETEDPILLDIKLSGVPDVNSVITLLNADKEELAASDLKGAGEEEIIKDIGIKKSGRYYLMISSNFESNSDVPYLLHISSRPHDYTTEIEPNNSPKKSNTITGNELKGRIFPDRDKDYYLYKNEVTSSDTPSLYRIIATPKSDLNLIIKAFDIDNEKLFDIDNSRSGEKEIMHALLPNTFYVELSSKRGDSKDQLYSLSIKSYPYSESYEIEPNDKKENATPINGNKITGFISKSGDIDYYYLEYDRRVRKNFTIHGIKDSEIKISVTDPLGYIIKTEEIKGNESKSFNEMIDLKGYIIVEIISDNFNEPYIVEIGE